MIVEDTVHRFCAAQRGCKKTGLDLAPIDAKQKKGVFLQPQRLTSAAAGGMRSMPEDVPSMEGLGRVAAQAHENFLHENLEACLVWLKLVLCWKMLCSAHKKVRM